jgi:hypothetical protein
MIRLFAQIEKQHTSFFKNSLKYTSFQNYVSTYMMPSRFSGIAFLTYKTDVYILKAHKYIKVTKIKILDCFSPSWQITITIYFGGPERVKFQ